MTATTPLKLVMAVHTVEEPTAKVPFSMILLLDHAKRAMPPGMRVRMVIPSDGRTSISLWDTDNVEALQQWLAENLGGDCTSDIHEVQEEFTYGVIAQLTTARTADRVAGNTKQTIGAIGETTSKAVERMGQGLREFDDRTGVLTTTKEATSAAAKTVSAAVGRVAENERVRHVVGNMQKGVQSGWASVSASLGWMGGTVAKTGAQPSHQGDGQQQHHSGGEFSYQDYHDDEDHAPLSTHAPTQSNRQPAAGDNFDPLDSLLSEEHDHAATAAAPLSKLSVQDDHKSS